MPQTGRFLFIWVIIQYVTLVLCVVFVHVVRNGSCFLDKAYLQKYRHVGDKPLGTGDCAAVWKVERINPAPGEEGR